MHLRLHNVDGATTAAHYLSRPAEVSQCTSHRDQAIHDSFWDRLAICSDDHVREHVVANIPDEAKGTTGDATGISFLVSEPDIRGCTARFQSALQNATDVCIHPGLVLCSHS